MTLSDAFRKSYQHDFMGVPDFSLTLMAVKKYYKRPYTSNHYRDAVI